MRALLGTASHFCQVVVLKLRTTDSGYRVSRFGFRVRVSRSGDPGSGFPGSGTRAERSQFVIRVAGGRHLLLLLVARREDHVEGLVLRPHVVVDDRDIHLLGHRVSDSDFPLRIRFFLPLLMLGVLS